MVQKWEVTHYIIKDQGTELLLLRNKKKNTLTETIRSGLSVSKEVAAAVFLIISYFINLKYMAKNKNKQI